MAVQVEMEEMVVLVGKVPMAQQVGKVVQGKTQIDSAKTEEKEEGEDVVGMRRSRVRVVEVGTVVTAAMLVMARMSSSMSRGGTLRCFLLCE